MVSLNRTEVHWMGMECLKMVMKISPHVHNCGASTKMSKNQKNHFGNILKYFLKISVLQPHFADFQKIFQQFSKNILKMFPKLFFRFFGIFELMKQFFTFAEIFIIIDFFLHNFLVIWKFRFLISWSVRTYIRIYSHITTFQISQTHYL